MLFATGRFGIFAIWPPQIYTIYLSLSWLLLALHHIHSSLVRLRALQTDQWIRVLALNYAEYQSHRSENFVFAWTLTIKRTLIWLWSCVSGAGGAYFATDYLKWNTSVVATWPCSNCNQCEYFTLLISLFAHLRCSVAPAAGIGFDFTSTLYVCRSIGFKCFRRNAFNIFSADCLWIVKWIKSEIGTKYLLRQQNR